MRLLELAEQCEAATGPDRELDHAIADAAGLMNIPRFTAALGASASLVPLGWEDASFMDENGHCQCLVRKWVDGQIKSEARGCGATESLARCAAALKARAASAANEYPADAQPLSGE